MAHFYLIIFNEMNAGKHYLNTKYHSQKKSYLSSVCPTLPTLAELSTFPLLFKKDSSKRKSIVAIGPQMKNYLCILIFASIVNLFQSKYFLMDMRRLRSNRKIISQSNYMNLADSDSSLLIKIVNKRL